MNLSLKMMTLAAAPSIGIFPQIAVAKGLPLTACSSEKTDKCVGKADIQPQAEQRIQLPISPTVSAEKRIIYKVEPTPKLGQIVEPAAMSGTKR